MAATGTTQCEKLSFETFSEAQKVINKAGKIGRSCKGARKRATKKPKRVYKCQYCGMYHLTSQKSKKGYE